MPDEKIEWRFKLVYILIFMVFFLGVLNSMLENFGGSGLVSKIISTTFLVSMVFFVVYFVALAIYALVRPSLTLSRRKDGKIGIGESHAWSEPLTLGEHIGELFRLVFSKRAFIAAFFVLTIAIALVGEYDILKIFFSTKTAQGIWNVTAGITFLVVFHLFDRYTKLIEIEKKQKDDQKTTSTV